MPGAEQTQGELCTQLAKACTIQRADCLPFQLYRHKGKSNSKPSVCLQLCSHREKDVFTAVKSPRDECVQLCSHRGEGVFTSVQSPREVFFYSCAVILGWVCLQLCSQGGKGLFTAVQSPREKGCFTAVQSPREGCVYSCARAVYSCVVKKARNCLLSIHLGLLLTFTA